MVINYQHSSSMSIGRRVKWTMDIVSLVLPLFDCLWVNGMDWLVFQFFTAIAKICSRLLVGVCYAVLDMRGET